MARTGIVVVVIVLLLVGLFVRYGLFDYRFGPGGVSPISHERVGTASVHRRAGPADAYPNLDLTPGAIDPTVTQDNIRSTICVSGYTKRVRPPEQRTHRLKSQIMAAYGRSGELRDYELDHFIPLELGGCPDCRSNLWAEPYDASLGAKQKDRVENYLHRQVCSGEITLKEAQDAIRSDWVRVYEQIN